MTSEQNAVKTLRIRPTSAAAAEPLDDPHYLPADPANLLHADPNRRVPVSFVSAGARIAGHLYRPPDAPRERRTAAIVMCGPFSSVKEQTLPHYAERFADAGYTVLTFDPRNFGESEGTPRYHHDPSDVIEDYGNAVNHMLTRDDVDAERVAVVGVCLGGGYAVSVGARDKRLKAVVSIGGGYRIGGTFQEFVGVEAFAGLQRALNGLVMQQYVSGEIQYSHPI
jgi:dipeptidyl aminopeptidase/acylaminoacyl peptidase